VSINTYLSTFTLRFARHEQGDVTTLGMLTVHVSHALAAELHSFTNAEDGVLQHVRTAITNWVNKTALGREAWQNASEDFNIGDLDSLRDVEKASLQPYLQNEGVIAIHSRVADGAGTLDFDALLVNPNVIDNNVTLDASGAGGTGDLIGYVEGLEECPLPTCPNCLKRYTGPMVSSIGDEMIHLQCESCRSQYSVVQEHDVSYATVIFEE